MMEKTAGQIPELSEERAAQILRSVFTVCGVPENKTPFRELFERSRRHIRMIPEDEVYLTAEKGVQTAAVVLKE